LRCAEGRQQDTVHDLGDLGFAWRTAVVHLLVDHERRSCLGKQAGDGARPDLAAFGCPAQGGGDRVEARLQEGLDDRLGGTGMPVAVQTDIRNRRKRS
jgi:hypothetical protein